MKPDRLQQEVLLLTTTQFSQKDWWQPDPLKERGETSSRDALEKACWNGLLNKILPELLPLVSKTRLFLWQVHPGAFFLCLEYCEFPLAIEPAFSIDPCMFILAVSYN
jgi:hypothetical protein